MSKVSVVIPVYGVEKYIDRCARSLFEQTLEDIEYIFVDDCSPDDSIEVLKKVLNDYPQRKNNTRIERMPHNSGLPAVRKYGVGLAHGEYIIACDSDDYVDINMYKSMYDFAVINDCDLVQCDIDVVDEEKVLYTITSKKDKLGSTELKSLIINGDISNSLCNKLVRRSVYFNPGLIFPDNNMDEDNALAVQLAFFASRLGYIKQSFYKAYLNKASLSRQAGVIKIRKQFEDSLVNSRLIVGFLHSHNYGENCKAMIKAKIRPKQILWPIVKGIRGANEWRNVYPEINWRVILDRRFSFRVKVKFLLVLSYLYPVYNSIKKKCI